MREQIGGNKCPNCGFNTYYRDLDDSEGSKADFVSFCDGCGFYKIRYTEELNGIVVNNGIIETQCFGFLRYSLNEKINNEPLEISFHIQSKNDLNEKINNIYSEIYDGNELKNINFSFFLKKENLVRNLTNIGDIENFINNN